MRKKYSLIGINGNAFCVMGYVEMAMRKVGMSKEEIEKYSQDATASDYNNLLDVSFKMIDVCNARIRLKKIGYKRRNTPGA